MERNIKTRNFVKFDEITTLEVNLEAILENNNFLSAKILMANEEGNFAVIKGTDAQITFFAMLIKKITDLEEMIASNVTKEAQANRVSFNTENTKLKNMNSYLDQKCRELEHHIMNLDNEIVDLNTEIGRLKNNETKEDRANHFKGEFWKEVHLEFMKLIHGYVRESTLNDMKNLAFNNVKEKWGNNANR